MHYIRIKLYKYTIYHIVIFNLSELLPESPTFCSSCRWQTIDQEMAFGIAIIISIVVSCIGLFGKAGAGNNEIIRNGYIAKGYMERKRYLYIKEHSCAWLIYGIGVGIFMCGIFTALMLRNAWKENEAVPVFLVKAWFLSALPYLLVMIYCVKVGNILGREAMNHICWRKYLAKNGIPHAGVIVGIVKSGAYRTGDRGSTSYYYRITYFSEIRREEVIFETPALAFNPYKKDYKGCTVYEVEKAAPWAVPLEDATDSVIGISGSTIRFTLNPFKLWEAIDTKKRQNWFGECVATDFR